MTKEMNEDKALGKDKVDLFPVFRTLYELVLAFEQAHVQFPKVHKFTVGKRISTSLIVALENVIEAIVSEERRSAGLVGAIVALEKTRILIRISHVSQRRLIRNAMSDFLG